MDSDSDSSTGSDYVVEQYVCPDTTRKSVNDESADLLGNFDDEKRKEVMSGKFPEDEEDDDDEDDDESEEEEVNDFDEAAAAGEEGEEDTTKEEAQAKLLELNTKLTMEQLEGLRKGSSKTNRFVLYVTNLKLETSKDDLEGFFSQAGEVKGVRIPKNRRGGFAFVEMADIEGFQRGFEFHNRELRERRIKIQISEGGKKKSANKKNIMKQKNRKLAEIRNEPKAFNKSGKFYDKKMKKVKAKEEIARQRWRKPNGGGGGRGGGGGGKPRGK